MVSVVADNISFRYPIYDVTQRSLKISLMRQVAGGRVANSSKQIEVQALSQLSFELREGDRLGLIGRNGSGKSTLLRVLAGLAHPQEGKLQIKGRVVPLIEKGLGIHPELSGMENIELPLRLLGATDAEVRNALGTIPEFTGLGNFIHLPVRTYSEGMRTRLSFAICTAVAGDILILDEWLGAGDIDFYERAQQRLEQFLATTRIVVVASHSNDLLRKVCNKLAWLDRGRLVMLGEPNEILNAYVRSMRGPSEVTSSAA